jgi:hypothetical protein
MQPQNGKHADPPADTVGGDSFFSDLSNTKPYLKIAFEGFAGSGKTYTMAQVAAGLHKRIGSDKPIVIFDTEEAAKFLRRFFDGHGIKVLHKRSRSLADLLETMRRCREGASDILMIDSITHVWENFLAAYAEKNKRKAGRLQFQDWGVLKPTWKLDFSDPFVRDPYHCLMTGRAGFEYTDSIDDEGQRQITKSGIKMKVEGETAYEPDLLVLMSRREDVVGHEKKVWREATLIKDRSTLIDGQTFTNPTFEQFVPAIDYILENPVERVATERDAADLFEGEDDKKQFAIKRDALLENIEGEMVSAWPGSSAEAKKRKSDALADAFGTRSWVEITKMGLGALEDGLARVKSTAAEYKAKAEAAA